MNLPNIKQLALSIYEAHFTQFMDDQLWYMLEYRDSDDCLQTFSFPIPISDTAGGTFRDTEKPAYMMRWMRRHIGVLAHALGLPGTPPDEPIAPSVSPRGTHDK